MGAILVSRRTDLALKKWTVALVELGVPKGEIVLAYQPVTGRRLTEFAVG